MSFSYVWPIVLIVASNVFYQIFAKGVPDDMDVMASMIVTYLTGAVCSAVVFFVMNPKGNLLSEFGKLNVSPFLLGVSVVGLEAGYILAFKAGWLVSTAQIVQSAFLAVILIFVGALLYHEVITVDKVVGVVICLVGLYFINR